MTSLFGELLGEELVVDNFAGGGGASTGIEAAIGRSVDIAINHDAEAIAMHQANHPATEHYCENVFSVDPLAVTHGQPVGLAWFSPDCKHFSKAKGGKPVSKQIRGLAWVVIRWAETVKPRIIMLENVEEFRTWCPLLENGRPDPTKKGETFNEWVAQLQACGYVVEVRELKAADYGTPTSRKRLFVIARCDGWPIVWPAPTHGKGLRPYRTAAECIDWSIPCPSIFERKRPLVKATERRLARGVFRYVLEAAEPYIVTMRGTSEAHIEQSACSIREPLRTISSAGMHHALVTPFLTEHANASTQRNFSVAEPLRTQCAQVKGGHFALVAAFLARHYGGHENDGSDLRIPMHTVTAQDHHALVMAFLMKYYGADQNPEMNEPLHTITTKHRFGLVTVHGEDYTLSDIGMRMLAPHELFRAQGFRSDYIINPLVNGKPLSKTAQVRMCGNSVCPPLAEALVRANYVARSQALAA